jgi:hypothetical protein
MICLGTNRRSEGGADASSDRFTHELPQGTLAMWVVVLFELHYGIG